MCGGDIEISTDKTFGTCEFCGSTMTFPKVDDEQRANMFNRGNHFRRIGEFDKALAVYEHIVQEDESDAEAHWCCALCRFGIEYVEDPNTFEYLPTCHRASFDSFLEDVDYLAAIQHSDGITRRQYQKDAAKIAEVQRGILATSQNEEPFDVFICYKESENDGSRTRDSLLAQDIYYQLTEQGRRVFFSRITLEDKAGTEYEPYIFAALNSAKVMVVVTTSAEHVNAVWVKNEWSRFLSLMRKDRSKLLLPCYRDMDPYDLPEALSVLQSYDMSKIGFIQDLIRGINKVLDANKPKESVKETVVIQQQVQNNVAPLLKRAFMFLEDGDFKRADEFCEQVLNLDPENAEAYLFKLMAELKVRNRDNLKNQAEPFDNRNNYQKAIRFGDDALKSELRNAIDHIKRRIAEEQKRAEFARRESIYQRGIKQMNAQLYKDAIKLFSSISGYKDASAKITECEIKAEEARKDTIYATAEQAASHDRSIQHLNEAISCWERISGWRDSDARIAATKCRIEEIKAKEEADRQERERKAEEARIEAERKAEEKRLEAERKAEEDRIAAEQRKKKAKITGIIIGIIAVIAVVVVVLAVTVFVPNSNYNNAMALYEAGQYEEAITAFEALNGYKDSAAQIEACETALKDRKYDTAVALYYEGEYEKAIAVFEALNGYKDSTMQIEACETALKDFEYDAALALYNAGEYDEAIKAFKALKGYKDSSELITKCETAIKDIKYNTALALIDKGDIVTAYETLIKLKGYKDSDEKAEQIFGKYKLKTSAVGDTICFGSYEQDNNTSNGKEEIEWLILAKDEDKMLVISKYSLDLQPYNTSYIDVTWETCSLRKWLNGSFLNAAFSSEEQSSILSSVVAAKEDSKYKLNSRGNDTRDKVFLLSITEAIEYFSSDDARKCEGTAYCDAKDEEDGYSSFNNYYWWWLRSPSEESGSAACVYSNGAVLLSGHVVHGGDIAVRPALWINLKF